ncbi:MAG TPA: hypothetical protein VF101_09670 [Gaiellaceae bacterium]
MTGARTASAVAGAPPVVAVAVMLDAWFGSSSTSGPVQSKL